MTPKDSNENNGKYVHPEDDRFQSDVGWHRTDYPDTNGNYPRDDDDEGPDPDIDELPTPVFP